MNFKIFPFLICFSLFFSSVSSQDKTKIKYGKISPEDLSVKTYSIDSSANAVVLADVGNIEIVGNYKGGFSFEFKHFKRIHILNKNGYEAANIEIPLYINGDAEEKLDDLKAVTYNIENGKVEETKLDTKSGIFKDVINKNHIVKKFTFPNIKEGSVIEYEYTVQSDFLFELQPWYFQGEYPVLWSECNFSKPEFLGYVFLTQGYQAFYIKDQKDRQSSFHLTQGSSTESSQFIDINASVTDYRWVMKNVPTLKEETYTSSIDNFIDKLNFQWTDIRYPLIPRNILGNWTDLTDKLLKADYFGADLNRNNGWLSEVEKPLIEGVNDEMLKTKRIYAYIRDNITCTSSSGTELSQSLKNILKTRNGNVAEVNLLLIAMLKYANISADPVMLSTRSHGYVNSLYPLLERFNYVICLAHPLGQDIFLDASQPQLGFGMLTSSCYNGSARIINNEATLIDFSADSLLEDKITSVFMNTDEKGNIIGSVTRMPGFYESHSIRQQIKEKGQDEFFKTIKKNYGTDIEVSNTKIDSLNNLERSINISYDFKMNGNKEDVIYLNPMLSGGYKQNPFKSEHRFYPVEMPYTTDETYVFSMVMPEGYVVDELPKSTLIKFNEQGEAQFQYLISESDGIISLRTRLIIKRTLFQPEEYDMLREFFNMIVKKQNEQIVLKKKK